MTVDLHVIYHRLEVSSRTAPLPTTCPFLCRCPATPTLPNSRPPQAAPSGSPRRMQCSGTSSPFPSVSTDQTSAQTFFFSIKYVNTVSYSHLQDCLRTSGPMMNWLESGRQWSKSVFPIFCVCVCFFLTRESYTYEFLSLFYLIAQCDQSPCQYVAWGG